MSTPTQPGAEPAAPPRSPDATAVDRTVGEALEQAVRDALPSTIAALSRLAKIPSVSWDGFDPENVLASAELVAEYFRHLGLFDSVTIERSATPNGMPGQPAVLAVRPAPPGRPTVLLYAHHDVQPAGDAQQWDSPPFEPTLRGERLYGRGTSDDKAGVLAHVAALRAASTVLGDLPLGVTVFIEGEEEFGSRSFSQFLDDHREVLAAEVIVVADSGNWDTETPGLTVSLRGNVTFNLRVRTLGHASHSGMLGGVVPDSMLATIMLLATLWDADGAVAVEGLTMHDAPTPAYDEAQLREESGLLEGVHPIGRGSLLARVWYQPSITITGLDGPDVVNASNTVQGETRVRVSMRVAPGQSAADAYRALVAHLESNAPFGAHLEFDDIDLGDPFLVDTAAPAVAMAEAAMATAWGRSPVRIGVGGSIPFIASLVDRFPSAQILVTGVEDPDTRAHSPNESLHLGVFRKAILTEALLLASLARA